MYPESDFRCADSRERIVENRCGRSVRYRVRGRGLVENGVSNGATDREEEGSEKGGCGVASSDGHSIP